MNDILNGTLVRLSAVDPEEFSKAFTVWRRDSEFMRLMDSNANRLGSQKDAQKSLEKELEDQQLNQHWFTIHTLADDRLIGDIGLYVVNWSGRDAFVGLRKEPAHVCYALLLQSVAPRAILVHIFRVPGVSDPRPT